MKLLLLHCSKCELYVLAACVFIVIVYLRSQSKLEIIVI